MNNPPLLPSYPLSDLRQLVQEAARRKPRKAAIKSKKKGVWTALNYSQLLETVEHLATYYFECGLQKGDRVAVLSENRSEWCVAYLAAVASGMVALPIDKDLKPREIRHILKFAQARLLVCGGDHASALEDVLPDIKSLVKTVSMEEEKGSADAAYPEALEIGYQALQEGNQAFQRVGVEPDDLAAIIFTSGTTGNPKGVMLTHRNIAADIKATSEYVSIAGEDDVLLSVLPLHHTYECTGGFLMVLYQGSTVCHAENLRRIPENLAETKTTIMLGVPLLFEMLYRRIEEGLRKKGEGKIRTVKKLASFTERFLGWNIRRRIFKELHQRFGGQLRLFISGGAAIDPSVSKGFRELGIDFIQGYGMTEAAPIIAVNRVNCFRDAAAGIPLPGVEVKIDDDEICVRGEIVMKGYYENDEATAETIQDGWLRTGDLGYLEDGFLYINGRKKSVIVTPNGKNVYPEELEAALNRSPFILESLVWGGPEEDPSKVEVQAIVVPDSEAFDGEFGASSYSDDKIHEVISGEIKGICKDMANYKKIKKFTLRQEEFEKTTTKKIKRFLYTGRPRAVAAESIEQ
ncbi:MAG TPA: AMP-binding protein [Acidobacteriota bacterium]|nr:AMP-binding protein [Acidobacteriota bacterium]